MTKKFFAELFGTMVLVLMGCGSAVLNGGAGSVAAILTIAIAFGLSVVAMAYAVGSISGCHINPAITLGVWLSGRMSGKEAGVYILAQVVGAIVGSAILYVIAAGMGITAACPSSGATYIPTGANLFGPGHLTAAIVAETVFTFIFVMVVLGATDKNNNTRKFAGLAIGLTLILIHIVCIPITGTSVNPARSIGPALFMGGPALNQLWLFILCPLVGAALASWSWKALSCQCKKSGK